MRKETFVNLIIETAKKNNITAYEIAKNTNLSTFGVQKILNGETKNPNSKTIQIILDFLENAIVGTNVKEGVEEPSEMYSTKKLGFNKEESKEEMLHKCMQEQTLLLKQVIDQQQKIHQLEKILDKNHIDY
jgi:transcriptional regulator with XRE-family HTH domain